MTEEPLFTLKEKLLFCLAIIVVVILLILSLIYSEPRPMNTGIITEKFRAGNQYVVTYHFVIDDDYDIDVDEETYYNYEVNDTYSWRY